MTNKDTITLDRLTAWKGNVRRTGARDGISELAASIEAHGLLQSLVVRKNARGKFEIIAGRRRYLALKSLAKAGKLPKNHPVACTLANDNIDASELSLAENIVRAPMHPADQFEAFRTVIDTGASIADVSARFGISEDVVTKRLKLGRLSPAILDAYRGGQISLEHAQAFAITDDCDAQERVFSELPEWRRTAQAIRRALTEGEIPCTDKRVRFVGLDAYEAAGGGIRRDLFADAYGGYVLDRDLLDRMVAERLTALAAEVSGEGWAWVETIVDLDGAAPASFKRRYPEQPELSEAAQTELDQLSEEHDQLADSDDLADALRLAKIQERMDELCIETWPAETLAIAGALVGLAFDGTPHIERGLVRPQDEARSEAADDRPSDPNGLSAKLVADLTAQKSAALGAEMIRKPDIALAAVAHALALKAFYSFPDAESCLGLDADSAALHRFMAQPDSCSGLSVIQKERALLAEGLPADPAGLWTWCLERSRDELVRVLTFVAADAANAVMQKAERPDAPRLMHAAQLAGALGLDMAQWFTPGADNFFGRIGRTAIVAAIDEAKGTHAPALAKLKKAELAQRAQDLVAGSGWLPAPLRANALPTA
jgi:ParB family chromosome partitioning protein